MRKKNLLKFLLIMKLTFILMFLAVVNISATVHSQNTVITLAMNTGSFGEIINAIEEQSEFKVFYKNEQINLNRQVSLTSKKAPVSEILVDALKGTDIGYTLIDKVIVLAPVEGNLVKQQMITGKVTAGDGSPLPGVNVIEKGTTNGTVTDIDGNYSITLIGQEATLVFSFIGYLTEEIETTGKTEVNVLLVEDIQRLDEVVVVGYGTVKKSDITGSLSSVTSEEIMEMPVQNVNQALQGRAAGVDVFNTGFTPGSAPTIRIRGSRSIKAGNDPLYILDGIPVESGIEEVNPLDIESVEVLKDASAAAIYGSRAANGVVLITTKRGTGRKASVNYEGSLSFEQALVTIDLMDGAQWAEMRRTVMRSEGLYTADYPNPVEDELWFGEEMVPQIWESVKMGYTLDNNGDYVLDPETGHPLYDPSKVRSYDWEDEALRTAHSQIHQLSVSGGTENLGVLLSVGYTNQEGIEVGQNYKRFSPRLNLDYQAVDWFKIGMSTSYSFALRDPGVGLYGACASQIPLSLPYDTAGNFIMLPTGDDLIKNPLRDNKYKTIEERTNRYLGSYYAEVTLWKGLKYRINAGIDYKHFRRGDFIEPESSDLINVNKARYRQYERYGWTVENL
ncbi:MAG: SusC/RagA family TonB-linked outer membrane protein, partial [Bacteroidales bacterium]|nr:SusC/RagA family TonB-linked outer membrane protein [Bacteroidales bacterium]